MKAQRRNGIEIFPQPCACEAGLQGGILKSELSFETGGGNQGYDEAGEVETDSTEKEDKMIPLYEDSCFTFRFSDDRVIPRFHLEGIEQGQQVTVFRIDPATQQPLGFLAKEIVGVDGWVDLREPIHVRAGDAFIAVPSAIAKSS